MGVVKLKNINDEYINEVVNQIIYNFEPQKIILFSVKQDLNGKSISFKLCIILDCQDKFEAERDIYVNTDSEIPFDIVIYTPQEFDDYMDIEGSFANKINNTGIVVYG